VKTGIQFFDWLRKFWIPAFVGMTAIEQKGIFTKLSGLGHRFVFRTMTPVWEQLHYTYFASIIPDC